ncbi:hypothetical protein [Bradyrhizobium sp.]|uniref:hypothetical protein n=1 Tax=Bradyrhizobium sp. TaxID=376 RepID=UPI003C5D353C
MSAHTPGPWHVGGIFMPNSDDPRANVWGPTPQGFQSGLVICKKAKPMDARLIAAAPDLLRACIESRKLGMKIYHNANAHEAAMDWGKVKALMDAAIEKAEGKAVRE